MNLKYLNLTSQKLIDHTSVNEGHAGNVVRGTRRTEKNGCINSSKNYLRD